MFGVQEENELTSLKQQTKSSILKSSEILFNDKKKHFHSEVFHIMEQVAQNGCGVSTFGNIKTQLDNVPSNNVL